MHFILAQSWVFSLKTPEIRTRTAISPFSQEIITTIMKRRFSGKIQSPKLQVFIFESYRVWLLKFEPLPFMVTAIKELNTSELFTLFWKAAVGCWNVSDFERVSDSSYWSISELRTKWQWLRVELLSLLFTIGAYNICCKIFPRFLRQRNFAPVYKQTGMYKCQLHYRLSCWQFGSRK